MYKKRIILITHLFPTPDDYSIGIFNLSRAVALSHAGHEILVLALIGLTPPEKYFIPYPKISSIYRFYKVAKKIPSTMTWEGVQVRYLKWFWLPKRLFFLYEDVQLHFNLGKTIQQIVKEFAPDLIISSWIHPEGTYHRYIKRYHTYQAFIIVEGSDGVKIKSPNYKRIIDIIKSLKAKIVCVSEDQYEKMKPILWPEADVMVNSNGYEKNLFYYTGEKPEGDHKKLLSVGNLDYIKGYDILLKALHYLPNNYSLTIIGDGPYKEELKKIINHLNISNRVSLIGKISHDELPKYYHDCDLYCLASRSESFGISVLEAMACGKPAVVSDVGGLKSLIMNGFSGFKFDPGNAEEMAEKILLATNYHWERDKISTWAESNFGWDKFAQNIIKMSV